MLQDVSDLLCLVNGGGGGGDDDDDGDGYECLKRRGFAAFWFGVPSPSRSRALPSR